jgi:hypothetical protein
MGQRIEIDGLRVIDDAAIVSTNRSLTGTDGEGFASLDDATQGDTFPARLAVDLFEADDQLTRVFVHQNVVFMNRDGGWPDHARDVASKVIEEFFLFYPPD